MLKDIHCTNRTEYINTLRLQNVKVCILAVRTLITRLSKIDLKSYKRVK